MKKPKSNAGRPKQDVTADKQIHLRVTGARKGLYVAASRKAGLTLAEWVFNACDDRAWHEGFDTNSLNKQPTPKGAK